MSKLSLYFKMDKKRVILRSRGQRTQLDHINLKLKRNVDVYRVVVKHYTIYNIVCMIMLTYSSDLNRIVTGHFGVRFSYGVVFIQIGFALVRTGPIIY